MRLPTGTRSPSKMGRLREMGTETSISLARAFLSGHRVVIPLLASLTVTAGPVQLTVALCSVPVKDRHLFSRDCPSSMVMPRLAERLSVTKHLLPSRTVGYLTMRR